MDEIELTLKRPANQGILFPEGYRSAKEKKLIDIGLGSGFTDLDNYPRKV